MVLIAIVGGHNANVEVLAVERKQARFDANAEQRPSAVIIMHRRPAGSVRSVLRAALRFLQCIIF